MENRKAKTAIITRILGLELVMFQSVPSFQRAACQDQPDTFKLHRRAQFTAWSLTTLHSYMNDLENARTCGINLMTEKYARMDDLIPARNTNPLIHSILSQQCAWQKEMIAQYPHLMSSGRPLHHTKGEETMTSFETYLRGELETYSEKTLEALHSDIQDKRKRGINMAEEIYTTLVKELGYDSLREAEENIASGNINT
jgi:hypothetical protein